MAQLPPLSAIPMHFDAMRQSHRLEFLTAIIKRCPTGGSAMEVGVESGYTSVWLSQRNIRAHGIAISAMKVTWAEQVDGLLDGQATFSVGDPFAFYDETRDAFDVVHHQDFLHRFTVPQIRALLSQHVASARCVAFTVPSIFSQATTSSEDRFLPIEVWESILKPFEIVELRYYGQTTSPPPIGTVINLTYWSSSRDNELRRS
jgi:hypothetical protein